MLSHLPPALIIISQDMDNFGAQNLLFENTFDRLQVYENNSIERLELAGYENHLSNQMVNSYQSWINSGF